MRIHQGPWKLPLMVRSCQFQRRVRDCFALFMAIIIAIFDEQVPPFLLIISGYYEVRTKIGIGKKIGIGVD